MRNVVGAGVVLIGVAVAVGIYLQASPTFIFISPQIISISPSHEAIIPYHSPAAAGPIEVKVKVDEKGYSTSDYDLTAFLIDPTGVATQAPHSAITTSTGSTGIVLSALVVDPFWSQKLSFQSQSGLTLKVTWTGKYKLAHLAFPGTFQATAFIKFPYMTLEDHAQNGSGSVTAKLSGPLDFPVKISLMSSNLNLQTTSFTIPANAIERSVAVTANPPHCPQNPAGAPGASCAYDGYVGATASPDDPQATQIFATASACLPLTCTP